MDWLELHALLTAGAVTPYVAEAVTRWIKHSGKLNIGAKAPAWCHFQRACTCHHGKNS